MIFFSKYENKIDKKGRVSVPASFRAVISKEDLNAIIAHSSFILPCVEAFGFNRLNELSNSIDKMDPYSEERDAFAAAIIGDSEQLNIDSEGRIMLSEKLMEVANLNEAAVFVGKGKTFEIWNPQKFADYSAKSKEIALKHRGKLRFES